MPQARMAQLQFPMGGLDEAQAYQTQQPYTTPDCQNVRPHGTLERRARGGSRPGLDYSHYEQLQSGKPIRLLDQFTYIGTDGFEYFTDPFTTSTIGAQWAAAAHLGTPLLPTPYRQGQDYEYASADPTDETAATLRALTNFDNSSDYKIEIKIVPYLADHHGKYQIFCRMDDTTPVLTTDGVEAELVLEGSDGTYSGKLTAYVNGNAPVEYAFSGGSTSSTTPGIFSILVSGNNVKAYWRGIELIDQAVATPCPGVKGDRVGFGVQCTQNDLDGTTSVSKALVDWFRIQHYVTGSPTKARTKGFVVSNGWPYQELWMGQWTVVGTLGGFTLPRDSLILSAERGGVLYIADPTAVRTYTPGTDAMATLTATGGKGTVPTGCPLIVRYRDRIMVAGAEAAPHIWYMSRQGDPKDWLYTDTDEGAAVAATSSPAGKIGEPILAMAAWLDDFVVFGCTNSLWILRGDPTVSGRLFNASTRIGIVDKAAWCFGPSGEFVFLSSDGLYAMAPDASSKPKSISRDKLPKELRHVDRNTYTVLLAYDHEFRGIHIYLTAEDQRKGKHWWVSWPEGTFWPVVIPNAQEPTAILEFMANDPSQNAVILGARDGYTRRYEDDSQTDGGTEITSFVVIGPLRVGGDDYHDGILSEIWGTLAGNSGQVTWGVQPSDTPEGAVTATATASGTWSEGLNPRTHPRVRAGSAAIKIENAETDRSWAVEQMGAILTRGGKHRIG